MSHAETLSALVAKIVDGEDVVDEIVALSELMDDDPDPEFAPEPRAMLNQFVELWERVRAGKDQAEELHLFYIDARLECGMPMADGADVTLRILRKVRT